MEKYYIFVGNFGSGKSEIAINMALEQAAGGRPVTLVDLDIVNPYFRSGERGDVLSAAGVKLIAPPFALHKIEITSLSPEVYSIFADKQGVAILDAGGDPIGATALGQYKPNFDAIPAQSIEVLMVINPFRPLAETVEKALALMENIQLTSRQKITGLINNANLAQETGGAELALGYDAVAEMSRQAGIPVFATAGTPQALEEFRALADARGLDSKYIGRYLALDIAMHRTWERYIKDGL